MYVNDLPHAVVSSDVYQYADDTLMLYCNSNLPTLEKKLQDDIDSIVHWLVSNKLWINVSKTESMLIGSRQRIDHQHMAVNTAGIPLCHACLLLLDILDYIDQHLTWQQHIDHVVSKARAQLYCLRHLHLSAYLFGLMYQVFIIPLFDYCDVVWTPCLAKQVRVMEHIHSKVISTVQHLRDRLSSCFYYSLVERQKFHTLAQIYGILHKMAPLYLQRLFKYSIHVTAWSSWS